MGCDVSSIIPSYVWGKFFSVIEYVDNIAACIAVDFVDVPTIIFPITATILNVPVAF